MRQSMQHVRDVLTLERARFNSTLAGMQDRLDKADSYAAKLAGQVAALPGYEREIEHLRGELLEARRETAMARAAQHADRIKWESRETGLLGELKDTRELLDHHKQTLRNLVRVRN
jgi:hypothetical protein